MMKRTKSLTNLKVVLNFCIYYLAWFLTVWGASRETLVPGIAVTTVAVLIHLSMSRNHPAVEGIAIFIVALLGTIADAAFHSLGVFRFAHPQPCLIGEYPLWMTFLWVGFATTFSLSLDWMRRRFLLAAFLGAVGGPLAMWGGVAMGAASFQADSAVTLLLLALHWSALVPLLFASYNAVLAKIG